MEYYCYKFIDSKVLDYHDSKTFLDVLSVYSGNDNSYAINKIVHKIFDKYFATEQLEEAIQDVIEIDDSTCHPLVVKYCISLSLDCGRHERELVSRFFARVDDDISESKFIKTKSLEEGMIRILYCIEDLYEDVPYVYQYVS